MKKLKTNSISKKIIVSVLIIVILVMTIANGIVYMLAYNIMLDMNKANMKIVADQIYDNFNSLVEIQCNSVDKISSDNNVINLLLKSSGETRMDFNVKYKNDIALLGNSLKKISSSEQNIEHIFITDKSGVIIADSDSQYLGTDLSKYDYFLKSEKDENAVSEVYTSVVTAKPIITFAQAIKNGDGEVIGVVGKSVYTDYFSNKFDKFTFLKHGFVFIVDSSQNIIYHPQKYYINKKVDIDKIKMLSKDSKIFKGKTANDIEYNRGKDTYSAYYITVPNIKSLVVLTVNEKDIKSTSNLIGTIILSMTLLMIIVIVAFLSFIIKRILKPMNKLIQNTVEISKGNLTVENEIVSNDEVGKLAYSFNAMTESIKLLLTDVKCVCGDLIEISSVIKDTQINSTNTMEFIKNNSNMIAEDTKKVDEAFGWCFNSFNSVIKRIEDIKSKSDSILTKVGEIRSINEAGINTITYLEKISGKAYEKLQDVNLSFEMLNENISSIKEIALAVTGISNQTHILALNASIEAAKAGLYGKSFNVVAVEIKKLSSTIFDQMSKIDNIITSINKGMSNVKDNIIEVNEISNSQNKVVSETADNYKEILKSVNDITLQVEGIYKGIDKLNEENNTIVNNLSSVKNISSDFNDAISEINDVVKNQFNETKKMQGLLVGLGKTSYELNANVDKFIVR